MKTTFSRTFSTTVMILFLALILVGTSFQALVEDYLTESAVADLQQNCDAISNLASANCSEGPLLNRDFMVNAVLYLTDDTGWMSLRQKQITLRLLNDQRAREERITAQVISIIVPLALLAIIAISVIVIRQKRYTKQA